MAEELPILKGILKGNFSYHNARKCKKKIFIHKIIDLFHFIRSTITQDNVIEVINKNASWMMLTTSMNHGRSLVD